MGKEKITQRVIKKIQLGLSEADSGKITFHNYWFVRDLFTSLDELENESELPNWLRQVPIDDTIDEDPGQNIPSIIPEWLSFACDESKLSDSKEIPLSQDNGDSEKTIFNETLLNDIVEISLDRPESWEIEQYEVGEAVLYKSSLESDSASSGDHLEDFSLETKRWYIGFSSDFKKSMKKMDKKLLGRILDALFDLSVHPTNIKGDTIKPLHHDLEGLWRYRIGDSRLIYKPDVQKMCVTLLSFEARGSIYK